MIVAISAVSESGDHYLWCEAGNASEVIKAIKACCDFSHLGQVDVIPLQSSEWESARDLKVKLLDAIDKARYGE